LIRSKYFEKSKQFVIFARIVEHIFEMTDKLKERIQKLIAAYETERAERIRLESVLEESQLKNAEYTKQITELERTIDNLKLADAFKAGNADNAEARKKIDRLIKEIDKCITLMEG
jgi:septal ring factor EnvC (AmiA/AmiB activator)